MVTKIDPAPLSMGIGIPTRTQGTPNPIVEQSTPLTSQSTTSSTPQTTLTSLPPEILVTIFLLLDFRSILGLSSTCRLLHSIPLDFPIIQYSTLLQITRSVNNSSQKCSMNTIERLNTLKSQEEGWRNLTIGWEEKIRVEHDSSGIYDLTGGIYLLGNMSRKSIHWIKLPSAPQPGEEPKRTVWNRVDLGKDDIGARVIDIGLNVFEHDLLAVVTTRPSPNSTQGQAILSIHLLSLSLSTTGPGTPHPSAQIPILPLHESPFFQPSIGIEIVGNNLILILSHPFNPFQPDDHLYVIDWKRGQVKMHISAGYHTYSSLVWVDDETFICPNTRRDCLDVWRVPRDVDVEVEDEDGKGKKGMNRKERRRELAPIRSLALPELTESHYISSLSCRGEPNPVASVTLPSGSKEEGSPSGAYSSNAFHPSPTDAIIIFNIRIQTFGIGGSMTFSMFVRRRDLLDVVPKRGQEDECPGMRGDDVDGFDATVQIDLEADDGIGFADIDGEDGEDEDDGFPPTPPGTRQDSERGLPWVPDGYWEMVGVHIDDDEESEGKGKGASGATSPSQPTFTAFPSHHPILAALIPQIQPLGAQPPTSTTTTTSTTSFNQGTSSTTTGSGTTAFTNPSNYHLIPHLTSSHGPIPIRWEDWGGPERSRWFVTEDMPTRWVTTTVGMRGVVVESGEGEGGLGGEGADANGNGNGGGEDGEGGEGEDGEGDGDGEGGEGRRRCGWRMKILDFSPERVKREEWLAKMREEEKKKADDEPVVLQKVTEPNDEGTKLEGEEREGEKAEEGDEEELDLEKELEEVKELVKKGKEVVEGNASDDVKWENEEGVEVEVEVVSSPFLSTVTTTTTSLPSTSTSTSTPSTSTSTSTSKSESKTRSKSKSRSRSSHPTVVTTPSRLPYTVFQSPIDSCLPYTVVETRSLGLEFDLGDVDANGDVNEDVNPNGGGNANGNEEGRTRRVKKFDGVLIDEERIVGLVCDEEDMVRGVWVGGVGTV